MNETPWLVNADAPEPALVPTWYIDWATVQPAEVLAIRLLVTTTPCADGRLMQPPWAEENTQVSNAGPLM
jgi:hypothetical protein